MIINNTLYDNTAGQFHASAVQAGAGTTIANCIVRSSVVSSTYPLITGDPTVSYSNVSGGWTGAGNIDADPGFVNAAAGDFHLRHDSPCRDSGAISALALPAVDFENDPRVSGTAPDIGADEFYPHLYHLGESSPGQVITIHLIGNPGHAAYWAISGGVMNPPMSIRGFTGLLHLDPSTLVVFPMGTFPPAGVIRFEYEISPSFPPMSIPMQALMNTCLSNLDTVVVR